MQWNEARACHASSPAGKERGEDANEIKMSGCRNMALFQILVSLNVSPMDTRVTCLWCTSFSHKHETKQRWGAVNAVFSQRTCTVAAKQVRRWESSRKAEESGPSNCTLVTAERGLARQARVQMEESPWGRSGRENREVRDTAQSHFASI